MTLRDHDNSVARKADTEKQQINASIVKRVLAVAREMQAKDPEMKAAWDRGVESGAKKLAKG